MRARLAPLVLQPDDLAAIGNPGDYQRFDEGPLSVVDQPGGARSDLHRFGRLGGWKARYRRADPGTSSGVLVIDSRIDVFSDLSGAKQDFEALGRDAQSTGSRVAAEVPHSFGESMIALVIDQPSQSPATYYTIAWRRGPFLAYVQVSGFRNEVSLTDATALAEAVDRRLAMASVGG